MKLNKKFWMKVVVGLIYLDFIVIPFSYGWGIILFATWFSLGLIVTLKDSNEPKV